MNPRSFAAIATLVAVPALRAQKARDVTSYLMADRAAEIALARTAAPADVSANATVMVLTPKGYIEAARGTNGFTCLVMRSFSAAPDDPQFWNPHISAPHCFNPPAARTVLPVLLAQIEWALAGATPAELKARINQGYAAKRFTPPAAGAMTYMLSPLQHLSDDADPHWMPHLMFYYARAVKPTTFGAGGMTAPIIDGSAGDPDGPVQVLFIPTRTWSDGTPVVRPAPQK
ncbi:MAG TPA: hypothetical protein VNH63_02920 [Gemmatimonadales bacterium]|nr:hypothetical protein [Gemmatimonadales bacterium]